MLTTNPGATLKQSPRPGFTLVELLIVIVVIAILAAISIVAYNSISARAKESKLVTTANTLEKKVHVKKSLDGQASPSEDLTSIAEVRRHYEIDTLDKDVVIQTYDSEENCVASRSDTCDWDDPVFERDDVVFMSIHQGGEIIGNQWSGCKSNGGVAIWHLWPTRDEDAEPNTISIPDVPGEEVGYSCWAVM